MNGIVVDIKGDRAVVLKNDGSFENIKNKNYKIGQKVSRNSKTLSRCLKIAACFALCFITATVAYKFYYTPYSYLYIDINPSVRLGLNYFDVVINCTPLNKDAEFISISSGDVEESINEVISECQEKGFLNDNNNEIEINISGENGKHREAAHNIESKYKDSGYKVLVKNTSKEEIEKANKHSISVKRQRTIEEFLAVFGGNTEENIEKLQDKTTAEIETIVSSKKKMVEDDRKKYVKTEKAEDHDLPEVSLPTIKTEDEALTEEIKLKEPSENPKETIPKEKTEVKKPADEPKQNSPVVIHPDKNVATKTESKEPAPKPTMPPNDEKVEPPKPEKQESVPHQDAPEQSTPEQNTPIMPHDDIDKKPIEGKSDKPEADEEIPVFVPGEESVEKPQENAPEKPDENFDKNTGQADEGFDEVPEKQPAEHGPQQSHAPAEVAPSDEKPRSEPEANAGRQPSNGMGGANDRPEPRNMR